MAAGIKFPQFGLDQPKGPSMFLAALCMGTVLCVMANLNTLSNVGIWMSESLPEAIRYGSWRWFVRAVKSVLIAVAIYFAGQLPWVPLVWNAAVFPAVATICLFVAVWCLVGPILKFSANLAWSRAFSVILSFPVFLAVPATAFLVGQMIVTAYRASHADLQPFASSVSGSPTDVSVSGRLLSASSNQLRLLTEWPVGSGEEKTVEVDLQSLSPSELAALPKMSLEKVSEKHRDISLTVPLKAVREASVQSKLANLDEKDLHARLRAAKVETRAVALRELYEASKPCAEYAKEIQLALDPKGAKNVVYWAMKDLDCSGLRAPVALPRLVQIMMESDIPQVRAGAIRAMKHFGDANVRQISYLLIKRIGPNESPEVVEAAASVLASLGDEDQRRVTTRLKALLNDTHLSQVAAKALIKDTGHDDLVANYVSENLPGAKEQKQRAVAMICLLPESKRAVAETNVSAIVSTIQSADKSDPGLRALECLGHAGFEAIRQEVGNPKQMDRSVAARALAELQTRDVPETIETANVCVRDSNPQVRRWCSQSLGELGAPALPKIIELLKSSDNKLKEAGKTALQYFDDPAAESELKKIMAENSGWMANNKNLQIARAVGTAVAKIENRASNSSLKK